ncbi:MFS transporter [Asticcacaulis sp. ZE23SCel15]|uniref:MFS transporter n=1 Tax=Asticcacaulis sp. ZE23SCel15 TaxID=3059027 RepID=UPI00349EA736
MIALRSGAGLEPAEVRDLKLQATTQIKAALIAAGYPEKADPKRANLWGVFAVLMVFALGATALYGPMASMLVEMFPTNVRYTALSLPYNIGTGWFGGLLPAISFSMVAGSGDIYFGLWYPVIIGSLAVVVALIFLKDHTGRDLDTIPDDE